MSDEAAQPGHSHSRFNSHSHSHDHGLDGGWSVWARDPVLRAVFAGVVLAALATLVGVVTLWPSGEGRQTATDNADDMGLAADRLSATVEQVLDSRCSYSSSDDPQDCRSVTVVVQEGPDVGVAVELPEINLTFERSIPDFACRATKHRLKGWRDRCS